MAAQALRGYVRALVLRQPTLRSIELAVTFACQASCPRCYAAVPQPDTRPLLSPREIGDLVQQALPLGLIHLNLTGGEALLRPDLFEIIPHCRPDRLILTLTTNGLALTPPLIRRLRDAGVRSFSISLDSPDASVHDRLRGVPGCFAQALAAAAWAREEGVIICFSTVIENDSPATLAAAEQLLGLAEQYDTWLLFIDVATAGGYHQRGGQPMSWAQRNAALARLLHHPRARHHTMYTYYLHPGCPAGREKIYVMPHGEVTPCNFSTEVFGSLRNEPLAAIVDRIRREPRFAGFRCRRYPPAGGQA